MKPLYVVTAIAPCDCTGDPRNVYVVHVDGKTSKSDAVAITGDRNAALDIADEYNNGERVAINARNREVAANARTLIAAAPDMLAALELAERNAASRMYLLPVDADAAERKSLEVERSIYAAAIAKARGERIG